MGKSKPFVFVIPGYNLYQSPCLRSQPHIPFVIPVDASDIIIRQPGIFINRSECLHVLKIDGINDYDAFIRSNPKLLILPHANCADGNVFNIFEKLYVNRFLSIISKQSCILQTKPVSAVRVFKDLI